MSSRYFVGIVFSVFLLCAQPVHADEALRSSLLAQIADLQAQIAALEGQLAIIESAPLAGRSEFTEQVDVEVRYHLPDSSAVHSIQNREQRLYFSRMLQLFPEPYRSRVGELTVFSGDAAPYDAYVETIPPNHDDWRYGVHDDLLSDPFSITNSCPARDSYLGEFVRQFWSDADLERAAERDSYRASVQHYYRTEDEFVSEYAAQNPEEDFAESFMYFVLDISGSGGVAKEKVDFFRDDEEVQRIKSGIARVR
jgi:hypothetical protein